MLLCADPFMLVMAAAFHFSKMSFNGRPEVREFLQIINRRLLVPAIVVLVARFAGPDIDRANVSWSEGY